MANFPIFLTKNINNRPKTAEIRQKVPNKALP